MKLTPVTIKGRKRWRVDYRVAGIRRQPTFATKTEAATHLATIQTQTQQHGETWAALDRTERAELIQVVAEIRDAGLTLRQVWDDHQRGTQNRPGPSEKLSPAIAAFLQTKVSTDRAHHYVRCLSSSLTQFAAGRGEQLLSAIGAKDLEEWLAGRKPSDRKTKLSHLSAFFSYARRQDWIAANPTERTERVREAAKPPEILTRRQCQQALAYTANREPEYLAWLALGMFAGLRPEEAIKTEWSAMDTKNSRLTVEAQTSKIRRRRVVDLEPAAVAWIERARALSARLPIPLGTHRKFLRRLRTRMQFDRWPQDVLRHTAATHLLAKHQDAQRVALQLGNSPGVLLTNYRALVTLDQSAAFWKILPK